MPTLAWAPQNLEQVVGTLVSVLEIHTDIWGQRPLLSPWFCQGLWSGHRAWQESRHHLSAGPAPPGEAGSVPSHLAALRTIVLEEAVELGTGCPMAGALAHALGGHLLDPAV